MSIGTKLALAVTLALGFTSAALAQPGFDPNLANRYPSYADPGVYGYSGTGNVPGPLQSIPPTTLNSGQARLHRQRQWLAE